MPENDHGISSDQMRLIVIQLVFGVGLFGVGLFFVDPTRFLGANSSISVAILGMGVALLYLKDGLMLLANSVIALIKNQR